MDATKSVLENKVLVDAKSQVAQALLQVLTLHLHGCTDRRAWLLILWTLDGRRRFAERVGMLRRGHFS